MRPVAVASLLLLTVLVYAPSLDHPFQYDDGHTLADNTALHQPGAWRAAFTGTTLSSIETPGGHYRPLTYLSYWATFRLAGPSPTALHAGNLALHLTAVLLLIGLVGRLTGDRAVGLLAGAIAALHPANSEAVLYASARAGLLAAVFSLAALWCLVLARERQAAGRSMAGTGVGVISFAAAALLAKETAVALLLLCVAADRILLRDPRGRRAARWGLYAPMAFGAVFYVVFTGVWRPAVAALDTPSETLRYLGVVAQQAEAIGLAARLFLVPWPLTVDHPLPELADPSGLFLAGLALALAAFGLTAARSPSPQWRSAGFFAAWAFIVALPTLLWPLNVPFQEHRAYFQHAGLSALAALGAVRLIDARPAAKRIVLAAGVFTVFTFAGIILDRGRVWADPVLLWENARARAPRSFRAHANSGLALAAAGRWDEADAAFGAALALRSDYPPALVGQGVVAHHHGDRAAARARYERAIDVSSTYLPALYNLGLIAQETGEAAAAERWYRRALDVKPSHASSLLNLGTLLLTQRRWAEAEAVLRTADAASPDSPDVRYHQGVLAELTGSSAAARRLYQDAERLANAAHRPPLADAAAAALARLPAPP